MAKPTKTENELVTLADLQQDPNNARKHNPRNIGMIETSLRQLGAARSGVIDENGVILAGNGTCEALNNAGIHKVKIVEANGEEWVVVRRKGLTAEQKRALAIADNRAAELAEWDGPMLAAQGIDLAPWFNATELKKFEAEPSQNGQESPEPKTDQAEALKTRYGTELGQIWQLGESRIMCGDCRNPATVGKLFDGAVINVALTSPPYASQRDYDQKSDFRPIPPDDYVEWWAAVQSSLKPHLAQDGSFFVNIKPSAEGLDTHLYVFDLVCSMVRKWGWHFATEFCWERNGIPKGVTQRFKNQFEPVYQFTVNRWKMRPKAVAHYSANVPVPKGEGAGNTDWSNKQGTDGSVFGKHRKRLHGTSDFMSDVQGYNTAPGLFIAEGLAFPGNRLPTFAGSHDAVGHAASFPVGLPSFFIKAYSDEADIIYEPFSGSGSTLIACEQLNRKCYAMEISPAYVAVSIQRWVDLTKKEPKRIDNARTRTTKTTDKAPRTSRKPRTQAAQHR